MNKFFAIMVFFAALVPQVQAQSTGQTAIWVARDAGWIGADVYRTKKSAEVEKRRIDADVAIQGGWQGVEHHRIDSWERVETTRSGVELERAKLEAATKAAQEAAQTGRSVCGSAGGTTVCGNPGPTASGYARRKPPKP